MIRLNENEGKRYLNGGKYDNMKLEKEDIVRCH